MNELLPRRARVLVGGHKGQEGLAVGRDDPRVLAHPQPGHQNWEVFLFFEYEQDEPLTGRPEDDGHGLGYLTNEVEFLA